MVQVPGIIGLHFWGLKKLAGGPNSQNLASDTANSSYLGEYGTLGHRQAQEVLAYCELSHYCRVRIIQAM
jgi:hypothetical protein